jgi:hypothetical protein
MLGGLLAMSSQVITEQSVVSKVQIAASFARIVTDMNGFLLSRCYEADSEIHKLTLAARDSALRMCARAVAGLEAGQTQLPSDELSEVEKAQIAEADKGTTRVETSPLVNAVEGVTER